MEKPDTLERAVAPDLFSDAVDTDAEAQGYDPVSGAPVDVGSNWLGKPVLEPEELGEAGARIESAINPEDREDNGQAGPTQENGGLGLGDEEGLGPSGLTEPGGIGTREHDAGGALDRLLQREEGSGDLNEFEEAAQLRREPELRADQLDTMVGPMYAEPNELGLERSESKE